MTKNTIPLKHPRVLIFIIAYEGEHTFQSVLERIPDRELPFAVEVLVIDDPSRDQALEVGLGF